MKDENVVAYIATKMADLVSMKMNKRLNSLEKALSEKECKIKHLEEKTTHFESKLDDLELYSQRNSVRISENGEDIENIITTVPDDMKVSDKIKLKYINRAHRISPRVSLTNKMHSRQIIVQFRDYKTKSVFIKERKTLRTKRPNVNVAEDLT